MSVTRCLCLAIALAAWTAQPAAAQPLTRCASCHFATMGAAPSPEYLADWHASAHAKHGVGCDKCHGGDPWTYEPAAAHRGVLNARNQASPVNPRNLVRTCSVCHPAIAQAFARSLHQTLVMADDRRAPTCLTCHGAMRARVPSPDALEQRCAACHGPGSARAMYPLRMRVAIEALNLQRERGEELGPAIERIADATRRATLFVALAAARERLQGAVARAHAFDAIALGEQVDAARRQLDAVAAALEPGR